MSKKSNPWTNGEETKENKKSQPLSRDMSKIRHMKTSVERFPVVKTVVIPSLQVGYSSKSQSSLPVEKTEILSLVGYQSEDYQGPISVKTSSSYEEQQEENISLSLSETSKFFLGLFLLFVLFVLTFLIFL